MYYIYFTLSSGATRYYMQNGTLNLFKTDCLRFISYGKAQMMVASLKTDMDRNPSNYTDVVNIDIAKEY